MFSWEDMDATNLLVLPDALNNRFYELRVNVITDITLPHRMPIFSAVDDFKWCAGFQRFHVAQFPASFPLFPRSFDSAHLKEDCMHHRLTPSAHMT